MRIWALALLATLGACGSEPAEVAPLDDVENVEDDVAFVPPEPPELEWYDLPTGRREREAQAAARLEEDTKRVVAGYVDRLVAVQAHVAADGLMAQDGLEWFEALGDRELMDDVLVTRRATGRGIAAACLLLALDDGHVSADRRGEMWSALDRVAGISFDWPEPVEAPIARAPSERSGTSTTRPNPGFLPTVSIGSLGGQAQRPEAVVTRPKTGVRAQAEQVLAVMGRIEGETGLISIPREPVEGWNPRSKRLFDEMPRVLRRLVDTDEIRARVSSHAEMRGW